MALAELFKILGLAFITVVCYIVVKPLKPEIAIFVSIIGSCLILVLCLDGLSEIINVISNIVSKTGVNNDLFLIVLKIIGIGYLVEFASSICSEAGVQSISDKIAIAGKICILVLSLPIISNLLNIIIEILP